MSNNNSGIIDPNKPLVEQLGNTPEVMLEKQELDLDHGASDILHRIGKSKAEHGMDYAGTIAIHMYVENTALQKNAYRIANITHIAMKRDISEALVATVMNNATIDIRTHFNPQYKFKTNRKNDKRGDIKK